MEVQNIEVVIGPSGDVSIEVLGLKGMGCAEITRELEKALGGQIDRTFKPEAYEEAVEVGVEQHLRA